MNWRRTGLSTLVLLGVMVLGLSGVIQSKDGRRLMIVLTTDTEGELNPCG
jgi:hypothetical protein